MRDPRLLVGGYAPDVLDEEERRELFEAALVDQELFDELATDEELREVLDDPDCRARLVASLEARRRPLPFLRRPAVVGAALALAATLSAVALWVRTGGGPEPVAPPAVKGTLPPAPPEEPLAKGIPGLVAPAAPATDWAWVFDAPLGGRPEPRLEASPSQVRRGGAVRVVFSCPEDAHVLLLELRADGSVAELFAGPAGAGELFSLPEPGHEAPSARGPRGLRRLRLVVAATAADMRSASAVRRAVGSGRAALAEAEYTAED